VKDHGRFKLTVATAVGFVPLDRLFGGIFSVCLQLAPIKLTTFLKKTLQMFFLRPHWCAFV
jgi:hypothetical protein